MASCAPVTSYVFPIRGSDRTQPRKEIMSYDDSRSREFDLDGRHTVTLFADDLDISVPVRDPVLGLRGVPTGTLYPLDTFAYEGRPKPIVVVGSSSCCDIVLSEDVFVSEFHCMLRRYQDSVELKDLGAKNTTMINCVPVGQGPIVPGMLITVGRSTFVAYGKRGANERLWIGARSLYEFIHNAIRLYRSTRQAAEALGVHHSTFHGWIKSDRFKIEDKHDRYTW